MRNLQEMMDRRLIQYLETALWASTSMYDDEPLDNNYTIMDFDRESVAKAEQDLDSFFDQIRNYDILADDEQVSHDFWLTRNGHGAGFWDRPELYPNGADQVLTDLAHSFGPSNIIEDEGTLSFYESTKKKKHILQIEEEFEIPGTDIILEKGDSIEIITEKMIISTFNDLDAADAFAKAHNNFLSYHRSNKVALSMDNKDVDKIKAELDAMGDKVTYILA